jgi:hypothetical protein
VVGNLPAWLTRPSCQIATCANSRCTSNPMHRRPRCLRIHLHLHRRSPFRRSPHDREWVSERHLRIRARSTTRHVAGAATHNDGLAAHSGNTGLPTLLTPSAPVPDGRTVNDHTPTYQRANRQNRRRHELSYRLQRPAATPSTAASPARPDHPALDLDRQRIRRRPFLGGLISEYERAA